MTQRDVLDYWFGKAPENRGEFWFGGDEETDLGIRERFGELYREAEARDLDHWAHTASGRLALIILLDQFSRNIHRDDPRAYDNDSRAQWLVEDGVHAGMDRELGPYQRAFFYMPLMHAENRTAQNHSVELVYPPCRRVPRGVRRLRQTRRAAPGRCSAIRAVSPSQ